MGDLGQSHHLSMLLFFSFLSLNRACIVQALAGLCSRLKGNVTTWSHRSSLFSAGMSGAPFSQMLSLCYREKRILKVILLIASLIPYKVFMPFVCSLNLSQGMHTVVGNLFPLNPALLLTASLICHFPLSTSLSFPCSFCLAFPYLQESPRSHRSGIFCSCHSSPTPVSGNRIADESRFCPAPLYGQQGSQCSCKVNGWEESKLLECQFQAFRNSAKVSGGYLACGYLTCSLEKGLGSLHAACSTEAAGRLTHSCLQ